MDILRILGRFPSLEGRASFLTHAIFRCFLFWLGVCLKLPGEAPVEARAYWDETSRGYHIAAKETRALLNAVQCLLAQSFNARVDVFVDNKVLLDSWEKQISKSPIISDTLKDLFLFTMAHNLSLSLHYVPSHLNPADQPSRVLSDLDCTLSQDR